MYYYAYYVILLLVVWNKKEQVHVWSVWAREHIHYLCVRLFHLSFRLVKYPYYTKTTYVFSQDVSNTHLILL